MLLPLFVPLLAALALTGGSQESNHGGPPLHVQCRTILEVLPVVDIAIANVPGGKVSDAVHHCRSQWHGHPIGVGR